MAVQVNLKRNGGYRRLILSGRKIIEEVQNGNIRIDPFDQSKINPNSYNLSLGDDLLIHDDLILDMKKDNPAHRILIPKEGLVLQPGILYLGRTVEKTRTDKYVPMLEGRSSVGRLGLYIHITAGFGDIGFDGYWTLELSCVQPVRVYPNVEICQIYYHSIDGDFDLYDSGKYNYNQDIQTSRLYKDFK